MSQQMEEVGWFLSSFPKSGNWAAVAQEIEQVVGSIPQRRCSQRVDASLSKILNPKFLFKCCKSTLSGH